MAEALFQELKRYVGFCPDDEQALLALHPVVQAHFTRIAEVFYARILQHPFMARNGWNSMHGDGPASDTHPESGPLGRNPQVTSTARGLLGGECDRIGAVRR